MTRIVLSICFVFNALLAFAQYEIQGFIFESGNRGFIEGATVTLSNLAETEFYGEVKTTTSGEYQFSVARVGNYLLRVEKNPTFDYTEEIVIDESSEKKLFLKHEIRRNPGYLFEITLAEKDPSPDTPRDALKGALVEVYNNTKKREELVIPSLETPDFKVNLSKGNHYTILIRKDNFLSKRMEAFVDVEGCILCFEGIGTVTPGVSDNLSNENTMGVLLANVEMDRYFVGKVIGINDIYYELGKSKITSQAAEELKKVAEFMKDNPQLTIELGSHTDSRGRDKANMKLSEKRAKAAVEYLVNKMGVPLARISAKGYGETQLTNRCADGVNCSEEEHRLNRRTELKVLDIQEGYSNRSLRQMKADELMDEILAANEQVGQIKVKEGEDIETALQRQAQESASDITSRRFEDFEREQTTSQPIIVEEAITVETPPIDKEELAIEKDNIKVEKVTEEEIESIIEESEIAPLSAGERYSDDYTGFKIVIIFSRFELPKEHQVYSNHKDVDIYTTADGNKLYMIGSYSSEEEAEEALERSIKKKYPQAYLIGFENGTRSY